MKKGTKNLVASICSLLAGLCLIGMFGYMSYIMVVIMILFGGGAESGILEVLLLLGTYVICTILALLASIFSVISFKYVKASDEAYDRGRKTFITLIVMNFILAAASILMLALSIGGDLSIDSKVMMAFYCVVAALQVAANVLFIIDLKTRKKPTLAEQTNLQIDEEKKLNKENKIDEEKKESL